MTTAIAVTSIIITDMFQYEFMTNAFAAAGIVAVVSGIVGYFLVMRGQTFAGHALSHIGFAGATGAGLIGLAPLWGLLGFTLAAGIAMGALSERISNRDIAIGIVLSLALGFGLLFLHYYTSFATQATALLFGNVLAVDRDDDRDAGRARPHHARRARRHHAAADFCHRCSPNSPKPKACRCASSRPRFSPSSRSPSPNARRSSASCWCSR